MRRNSRNISMKKKYGKQSLGIPTSDDWSNVGRLISYLKLFYDVTVRVSRTSYVTLHLLFDEICEMYTTISEWVDSIDFEVGCMAERIKSKLAKYWFEEEWENSKINRLCYMAVILDPRRKMEYLEEALKRVYGESRGKALAEEVKDEMRALFDHYKHRLGFHSSSPIVIQEGEQEPSGNGDGKKKGKFWDDFRKKKREAIRKGTRKSSKSEFDRYLEEEEEDEEVTRAMVGSEDDEYKFDILGWWSRSGMKYPIIFEMARDIFAVPISTVASESAFSTGGRVLDLFRTSLSTEVVEALICCEDWIRSSDSELVADGEDEGDEVVFQNVFAAFQTRSASAPAEPSGSSHSAHVLISSPTGSQVEEDYFDEDSDGNDETCVDVESDEVE
ncbi:unnamed protein product [Linum tenue]|uniref:Transposase n=1 Tax=Linum tenue TaxID=586396 RepID=A0AAV0NMX3_9ROSI|nr:unnamed protein product [Linum tenue]